MMILNESQAMNNSSIFKSEEEEDRFYQLGYDNLHKDFKEFFCTALFPVAAASTVFNQISISDITQLRDIYSERYKEWLMIRYIEEESRKYDTQLFYLELEGE